MSKKKCLPLPTDTKAVGNNNTANNSGKVKYLNIFKTI